jgi:hypothetical protein
MRLVIVQVTRLLGRCPRRRECIELRQRLIGITKLEARRSADIRVGLGKCRAQPLDQSRLAGTVRPEQGYPIALLDP